MKICVMAPPEKGKANGAVEVVLAKVFAVAKERVRIVSGHASSRKTVEIDGLEEEEVHRRLAAR